MMMQLEGPTSVVSGMVAKEAAAEVPLLPPKAMEEPDGGGEIIIGMDDDDNNTSTAAAAATSSGEGDIKMNSGGGNRWPRQETLALLKIRSDMDSVFRDSSLKGPLWEEVSRKLRELGYQRSAKKCKEKFENVYKYHKRTKDSRSAKTGGRAKTYRFFNQLEAFESRFTLSHHQPQPQSHHPTKSLSQPSNLPPNNTLTSLPFLSRPSDHSPTTFSFVTGVTTITTANNTTIPSTNNPPVVAPMGPNANLLASTSSSTDSDEDLEERYRKKRKWKHYFRRLTRRVFAKQEEMQKRFLEAIDKRERERVAQQEAWRMQEMARINREHEILVQERSTAATEDAAIIAFLKKLSGGSQQPPHPQPPLVSVVVPSQFQSQPPQQQQKNQQQQPQPLVVMPNNNITYERFEIQKMNNNNRNINGSSGCGVGASSRWPTAEVHALIRLRTNMEAKYQENGPKAPLWEEISREMQKLGYNRNAKRCKEKWENINKYFKKIKESNKHRHEDSKTCPYYNELEALYKEKTKAQNNNNNNNLFSDSFAHNVEPLMVQPEQQWRPPTQEEVAAREYANHQYQEKDDEEEDEGGVEEEEEEEDGGRIDLGDDIEMGGGRGGGGANGGDGGYEHNNPKNKLSSVDTVE